MRTLFNLVLIPPLLWKPNHFSPSTTSTNFVMFLMSLLHYCWSIKCGLLMTTKSGRNSIRQIDSVNSSRHFRFDQNVNIGRKRFLPDQLSIAIKRHSTEQTGIQLNKKDDISFDRKWVDTFSRMNVHTNSIYWISLKSWKRVCLSLAFLRMDRISKIQGR